MCLLYDPSREQCQTYSLRFTHHASRITHHASLPMTRTGKIARLPQTIRDQLNRRLDDGEPAASLIDWLNSLPKVQAVLRQEFSGRPINAVNLCQWKNGGYRDWLVRQDALNFVASLQDKQALGDKSLTRPCIDHLMRWLALQYAAATQALLSNDADPLAHWARLRELCTDLSRLHRADLLTQRLDIGRQWLALANSNSNAQKEKEFWAWTKRPDIHAKLHGNNTRRMLDLLTLLDHPPEKTTTAPAPAPGDDLSTPAQSPPPNDVPSHPTSSPN